jgi:hypothetical protein
MTLPIRGRRRGAATSLIAASILIAGCSTGPSADDATVIIPAPTATEPVARSSPVEPAPAPAAEAAPVEPAPAAEAPATAETAEIKAEGWGTIKGRVVLQGEAPAPAVLVRKGDNSVQGGAVCSAKEIVSERLVVNPEDKGVRYAIVYVPRPTAVNPEAESAAKNADVDFDQKGCKFVPHVLAAMKGTKVALHSSDPITHNINVMLTKNKTNITVAPGAPLPPIELKNAEVKPGEVVCDIHTWMKSYWMVVDSPYFAVTDAHGNFTLKDVPAGTQKVVVWQEAMPGGFLTPASGESVNVAAGGETTKDFTLDVAKLKP